MPSSKDYIPILKECFLFQKLTAKDLAHIANELDIKVYTKGSEILTQDTPGDSLYVIISGIAKVSMHDPHGRKNALTYLNRGDAFGEISVFAGENCTADVTAFSDLSVAVLSKDKMIEITKNLPHLAYSIIQSLCERIRYADSIINDLAFKNMEGRVAAKILSLADKFGQKVSGGIVIDLSLTHNELAELVGTNRETVTKTISRFRKEGSIDIQDSGMLIRDIDMLAAWAKQ